MVVQGERSGETRPSESVGRLDPGYSVITPHPPPVLLSIPSDKGLDQDPALCLMLKHIFVQFSMLKVERKGSQALVRYVDRRRKRKKRKRKEKKKKKEIKRKEKKRKKEKSRKKEKKRKERKREKRKKERKKERKKDFLANAR